MGQESDDKEATYSVTKKLSVITTWMHFSIHLKFSLLVFFFYPECHLRLSLRNLATEDPPLPSLVLDAALSWPKLLIAPPQRGDPAGDLAKMGAAGALNLLRRLLRHLRLHLHLPNQGRSKSYTKCRILKVMVRGSGQLDREVDSTPGFTTCRRHTCVMSSCALDHLDQVFTNTDGCKQELELT